MNPRVTVVGGGLGGLVAASALAERGVRVHLFEATARLGGRGWTTPAPFRANWGPHVLYSDGPTWQWLAERQLLEPYSAPPRSLSARFRYQGDGRRVPPVRLLRAAARLRKLPAPIDRSFAEWATEIVGDDGARLVSNAMGVATFDRDPGRWSARFVKERLRRVTTFPPTARYIRGGWGQLVERLARYARSLGVQVETGAKVERLDGLDPVIVATSLRAAALLTGDTGLWWHGTRTALLDVGLRTKRRDPFLVSDLDEAGWVETYSAADGTLAPSGHSLLQAQIGLRPEESLDGGIRRTEALLDAAYSVWREREVWRRRAGISDETGALDPPGATWRDRPAVDRGGGVYVVTDMSAAPGLLSEVTFNAAMQAVELLTERGSLPSSNSQAILEGEF